MSAIIEHTNHFGTFAILAEKIALFSQSSSDIDNKGPVVRVYMVGNVYTVNVFTDIDTFRKAYIKACKAKCGTVVKV